MLTRERTGLESQRRHTEEAFNLIADLLRGGCALTWPETKALLVGHGYSPRTTLVDAGVNWGDSRFSRVTGVSLERYFHRGRMILVAEGLPYEETGIERAKQRINWAMTRRRRLAYTS